MSQSRSDVQINVNLHNSRCIFSCCQHASALVTDLVSGEKFEVDLVSGQEKRAPLEMRLAILPCVSTVTLYGNRSYSEFVSEYKKKYPSHEAYDYCSNNCADAVKFTLDYFFSDRICIDFCCYTWKTAFCLLCIATCGANCFPSLCVTTPSDVFDLARALSFTRYGRPSPPLALKSEKTDRSPLLSEKDNHSVPVITSRTSPALLASPPPLMSSKATADACMPEKRELRIN